MKSHAEVTTRLQILLAVHFFLASCGSSTHFGGNSRRQDTGDATRPKLGTKTPQSAEDEGSRKPKVKPFQSMTWLWQCQDNPEPVPQPASDRDLVVEGKGPFEFEKGSLDGTSVTFSGRLCPPTSQPRDIVFIIDTSASMIDNDPRTGDSCGRLNALQSVLTSLNQNTEKFAIVTFNTALAASSTMLYDSKDALLKDFALGAPLADTVCLQDGTTNYNAALTRASELLATGRPLASKEIYFISDGQPNPGEDGILLADSLKNTGITMEDRNLKVTIGTIMLAGTDTVLESAIASRDPQGKPLHYFVAQTADLTQTLTELARNEVVAASLKFRIKGEEAFQELDIMAHLQGLTFSLPPMTWPLNEQTTGVEVIYEYTDKIGQTYSSQGELLLTVTKKPAS